MENILIYRLGSLGDTVVALPCFNLVRRTFPNARITLLTNKPVASKAAPLASVLGTDYFFDDLLSYPVGARSLRVLTSLAWEIRRRKIDTVIFLIAARGWLPTIRDRLFFRLSGVRRIIGYPKLKRDFVVQVDPETGLFESEALRLARRLEDLGTIDLDTVAAWDLHLTDKERAEALALLGDDPTPRIFVSLGTKIPAKDWEEQNWSKLLSKLGAELPTHRLVLIGSLEESERSLRCSAGWRGTVTNLCGITSPRVTAAAMDGARAFIGHDSGPMHLAAAMQVPCVSIFSARNLPGHWFPYGARNQVIYHKTECFGCDLEVCIEEKKRCILSISPDEVVQAVLRVLSPKMQDGESV